MPAPLAEIQRQTAGRAGDQRQAAQMPEALAEQAGPTARLLAMPPAQAARRVPVALGRLRAHAILRMVELEGLSAAPVAVLEAQPAIAAVPVDRVQVAPLELGPGLADRLQEGLAQLEPGLVDRLREGPAQLELGLPEPAQGQSRRSVRAPGAATRVAPAARVPGPGARMPAERRDATAPEQA